MELSTTIIITKGRRYVYDGWMAVAERKFEAADSGTTTLEAGASKLERIYVTGPNIDEWLYAAIDFNSDGDIRDDLNSTECSWFGGVAGKDTADAAYYFLTNRMGSVAALLDKNNDRKILEYYRYRSYGEVTVLTVLDDGTSPGTASDGIEDTPSDLGDNPTRRISKFANALTFTGRRLDDATGVMYYRHRMYDPVSGKFVGRDPAEYHDSMNLYQGFRASPGVYVDPIGEAAWAAAALVGAITGAVTSAIDCWWDYDGWRYYGCIFCGVIGGAISGAAVLAPMPLACVLSVFGSLTKCLCKAAMHPSVKMTADGIMAFMEENCNLTALLFDCAGGISGSIGRGGLPGKEKLELEVMVAMKEVLVFVAQVYAKTMKVF